MKIKLWLLFLVIIANVIFFYKFQYGFRIWGVGSGVVTMLIFLFENKKDIKELNKVNIPVYVIVSLVLGWLLLPYQGIYNLIYGREE